MAKRIRGGLSVPLLAALVGCGQESRRTTGPSETGAQPATAVTPASGEEKLAFSLVEGNTGNHFFRQGTVVAHLLATSGVSPRIVVAFPGGNAGIGVWFEKAAAPVALTVDGALEAVQRPDGLRGVRFRLNAAAPRLRTHGLVLSNLRFVRDYATDPQLVPPEVKKNLVETGPPFVVRRVTLDGQHHVELVIEPRGGTRVGIDPSGAVVFDAAPGRSLEVTLTFLHDDPPVTPIPLDELLTSRAAPSERDRRALSFLVYREKMLAGSWRFLTYFGRDTLLSLRMLMPVLKPAAIEGGLGSVLDRLNPAGEVAHEEDIGEFAAFRNQQEGRGPILTPIHDYKMVDDDFMLAPVLAHYLLDTDDGRARAAEFLARRTPTGQSYAVALAKNLEFVETSARPFAQQPVAKNLVGLKPKNTAGNWRDSEDGLGGGRFPFDINVALVPAALAAGARLHDSKLLCPTVDATCAETAAARSGALNAMWAVWRKRAAPLFRVEVTAERARKLLTTYAAEKGLNPAAALEGLTGPVVFPSLSLDARGRPVPVMHSDDSFVLLFGDPDPAELERIGQRIERPFPLGLRTPVGVVIANPAFVADQKLRGRFDTDRYHGAVIWSWQQAMLAAGLTRQLARTDLPEPTRKALISAEDALWQVIAASDSVRIAEHWSWKAVGGGFEIFRFGEGGDSESNAAQLWSTVYLAVQPPARAAR